MKYRTSSFVIKYIIVWNNICNLISLIALYSKKSSSLLSQNLKKNRRFFIFKFYTFSDILIILQKHYHDRLVLSINNIYTYICTLIRKVAKMNGRQKCILFNISWKTVRIVEKRRDFFSLSIDICAALLTSAVHIRINIRETSHNEDVESVVGEFKVSSLRVK